MSKLKRKATGKIKLHSTFKSDTIKFSWQYLTTNKTHNFDYFKGDLRQELSARQGLSDLVKDLCFAANGYQFSSDQKVIVFRFGNNSGFRLLGVKGNESNVLYVIGYDFDYSAYNHGS